MAFPLTLSQLAARSGNDALIGLVDDVIYNSPEMQLLPTRPVVGTSYRVGRVTSFPAAQFTQVGQGATPSNSVFNQEVASLYWLDLQLELAEAIVKADEGNTMEDLLTGESSRALRSAFQLLGKQVYYGLSNDPNGFQGLQAVLSGQTGYEIDASAGSPNAAGSNSSAYLVRMANDGVSMAVGRNGIMELAPWAKQQVSVPNGVAPTQATIKKQMAYVSNFSGFFGLTIASQYCAWRIKNISSAIGKANGGTTFNLTDQLGAELVALIPLQFRKDLRWFMTRDAAFSLQASRTAVTQQVVTPEGDYGWSAEPTKLAGIEIIQTDSLKNPVAGVGGE